MKIWAIVDDMNECWRERKCAYLERKLTTTTIIFFFLYLGNLVGFLYSLQCNSSRGESNNG
jgi:hypothetical protein